MESLHYTSAEIWQSTKLRLSVELQSVKPHPVTEDDEKGKPELSLWSKVYRYVLTGICYLRASADPDMLVESVNAINDIEMCAYKELNRAEYEMFLKEWAGAKSNHAIQAESLRLTIMLNKQAALQNKN
jgi:hypothetical protein